MSHSSTTLTKQQRIQVWREEVAASASLCTCPPSSPAASASSTNISLSAASSSASSSASSPGAGDAFTFPRSDILPGQGTYCPTCSRLGAPSAMGLEPSSAYLDQTQPGGGVPGGHIAPGIFRTKTANHALFRGMRNFVRKLSGSSRTGGPMPPSGADDATKMYRRATLAGWPTATNTAATAAAEEAVADDGDCAVDEADSEGRGHVPKLITEKQARLRRAERLLARTHGTR
ncbi:hypothetical protein CORC01_13464 [Colletotrichum orchidophilum]|uniref:Uncharacterized protein n=1 Tax=Colletotrichum orchidophilum TaxID=1209926 RepID=A0A1G4AQ53_9PEZI|nr:uncharacterized protein CORC01_13464 [Colletotrichum orchidophilum]OHE91225.1 hypothetical protein CORC01_13464 [Colletotrichum orchidophilum]